MTTEHTDFKIKPAIVPNERPGPEGGKRDRNRRMRTRQIGEAALELFLDKGVDAVTIDAIVKKAGVAKGSFYRYFESKSHVVESLFAPLRQAVSSAMNRCRIQLIRGQSRKQVQEAYKDLAETLGPELMRYRGVTLLYLQESRGPKTEMRAPLFELRKDLFEVCVAVSKLTIELHIAKKVDPEVIAVTVLGIAESVFYEFLLNNEEYNDPRLLAKQVIEVLFDGVLTSDLRGLGPNHIVTDS